MYHCLGCLFLKRVTPRAAGSQRCISPYPYTSMSSQPSHRSCPTAAKTPMSPTKSNKVWAGGQGVVLLAGTHCRHTTPCSIQPSPSESFICCKSSVPGIAFTCYVLSLVWLAAGEAVSIFAIWFSVSIVVKRKKEKKKNKKQQECKFPRESPVLLYTLAVLPCLIFAKHRICPGLYMQCLLVKVSE